MNKEVFEARGLEQPIRRPVFQEQPRVLRQYTNADFAPREALRLDKVREEIALLPIINVIVPTKQEEAAQPEPKTMGEAFMDLLFGFVGLALVKTGEFMESFGEKK